MVMTKEFGFLFLLLVCSMECEPRCMLAQVKCFMCVQVGVGGCKGWARSPWVEECMADEVCGGTNYAQIAPHMGLDVTNN